MMFGTTREGVIVGWWVAKPFPSGNEAQNVRDWLKAAWERHLSFMDDRESYRGRSRRTGRGKTRWLLDGATRVEQIARSGGALWRNSCVL
jgi:hypothetical protein